MAGLRDQPVSAANLVDAPNADWSAGMVDRAGASPMRKGLRSSDLSIKAGERMQASLEAAARGDKVEALLLRGEAEELSTEASSWAPPVPGTADVNSVSDAVSMAAGMAGSGVRSTLPSLAAGTAAAILTRGHSLKRGLRQAITGGAAAVPAYQMEKGETVLQATSDPAVEQNNTPQEILDTATAKGAINAIGEAVLPTRIAMRTAGGMGRQGLRAAGKELLKDTGVEAGTETVQTAVGQAAHTSLNPARDKSGDVREMVDAAVSGAVTAPVLGGHTMALEAAKAIAEQVRARSAPLVDKVMPGRGDTPPAAPPGGIPLDGGPGGAPPAGGPFETFKKKGEEIFDRAKEAWLQGKDKLPEGLSGEQLMSWVEKQDILRREQVGEALNNDPGAQELSERYHMDPEGTYVEALGYLTKKHGVERLKRGIYELGIMAEDFYKGATGKGPEATVDGEVTGRTVEDEPPALPKPNLEHNSTDRALMNIFSSRMPDDLKGEPEALQAADLMRSFARGQLDDLFATQVAGKMVKAFGEDASTVALEAAEVLVRSGVPVKDAQRLPKIINDILSDEDSRNETMTRELDSLVDNDAREQFAAAMGRPFGKADMATVVNKLDAVVTGEDNDPTAIEELFGDRTPRAMAVARAVHDRRARSVSQFNNLLNGRAQPEEDASEGADEFDPVDDFSDRTEQKAIDKNSPVVYSFSNGQGVDGVGRPYDIATESEKILERIERLEQLYPGASVEAISAAAYAKEAGVTPAALVKVRITQKDENDPTEVVITANESLQGKVVLRVTRPTTDDALNLDRDVVKKLVGPQSYVRKMEPGDRARAKADPKRYNVIPGDSGKIEIRYPGIDEGAMYLALNKADGTPLMRNGERSYGMVRTNHLIREMRKRDQRENITSSEASGGDRELQLLLTGIGSLMTAEGAHIDLSEGLTFISPDGKKRTTAFKGEATRLPAGLKIGNTTVGKIIAARAGPTKTDEEVARDDDEQRFKEGQVDALIEKKEGHTGLEEDKGESRLLTEEDTLKDVRMNTNAQLGAVRKPSGRTASDKLVDKSLAPLEPKGMEFVLVNEGGVDRATVDAARVIPEVEKEPVVGDRTGGKPKQTTFTDERSLGDEGEIPPRARQKTRGETATESRKNRMPRSAKMAAAEPTSLDEKRREKFDKKVAKIVDGLSDEDFATLQNDTPHADSTSRIPSKLRADFREWLNDSYSGAEREERLAHENLRDTENAFLEEVVANEDSDALDRALAHAALGGNLGPRAKMAKRGANTGDPELDKFIDENRDMTDEEMQEIREYVLKVLGPEIAVLFERELKADGQPSLGTFTEERVGDVIRIAIDIGTQGMNIARHEALHGFMAALRRQNSDAAAILQAAAGDPYVTEQLRKLLHGQQAATSQLNDVEERAAYMYQFWAAGKLKLKPEAQGLFEKIKKFFRGVFGLVRTSDKAEAILQAFHDGKMKDASSVAEVLHEMETERAPDLRKFLDRAAPAVMQFVQPAYDGLKNSGNAQMARVAELFWTDPTSTRKNHGYLNALSQQKAIWLNRFSLQLGEHSKEDLAAALEILQGAKVKAPSGKVGTLVNNIRSLLGEGSEGFFTYMKGAGVDVRFRKNYFPRVWDMEKIIADPTGFEEKLLRLHRAEMEEMGQIALDAAIKEYQERLRADLPAVAPDADDYTAAATAKHIIATLSSQGGYVDEEGQQDPGKAEINEDEMRPGYTPFMQAVNRRTLDFLDMKEFGEYQQKDLVQIMSTYLAQGVRRAEYARRFGNHGERLAQIFGSAIELERERVKAEMGGSKQEVAEELDRRVERYARAIRAMEGTLGYDISPTLRRVNSAALVYQNMRILPLALFSSLIDPMGLLVRGGTVNDAFMAFKRGMRDLTLGLHKDGKQEDAAEMMAEMMGTVDNKLLLDALGETYNSVYLYGWAKKLNEHLFKWNGMEPWNRAMRVQATQAAISFIKRQHTDPGTHSKRWLAELGLKPEDIVIAEDGSLKVFQEEGLSAIHAGKMRSAVQRWVDTAVLRPNAAQRPPWASDPHYVLLFHLKQFTYSFHTVILRRIAHEWKHGNLNPGMALASYVPFMLAADVMKGLLQGMGEEPDWKKGWTVGDYMSSAVQRAGLLGIAQFAVDAGQMGVSTLGGPTFEQLTDLPFRDAGDNLVRALPANPVYRDALL